MMTRVSKGKMLVVLFLMLAMVMTAWAMPTFANDHADRRYSFVFSRYEDKTDFLHKTDSTPVYVKCQSASAPWKASVLGSPYLDSEGDVMGSYQYLSTGTVAHISVPYYSSYYYGVYGIPTVRDSAAWGYWSPDSL